MVSTSCSVSILAVRSATMFVSSWPMRFAISTCVLPCRPWMTLLHKADPGPDDIVEAQHTESCLASNPGQCARWQPQHATTLRCHVQCLGNKLLCVEQVRLVCDDQVNQFPQCSLNTNQSCVQHSVSGAHLKSQLCKGLSERKSGPDQAVSH